MFTAPRSETDIGASSDKRKPKNKMKTQAQVRESFWDSFPEFQQGFKRIPWTQNGRRLYRRKTQNDYPADVRMTFVDYVDSLARDGQISEQLASRVTL